MITFKEYLTESITLAQDKGKVKNAILDSIKENIDVVSKKVELMFTKNPNIKTKAVLDYIKLLLHISFTDYDGFRELTKVLRDEPYNLSKILVQLRGGTVHASAGDDYIIINVIKVDELISAIVNKIGLMLIRDPEPMPRDAVDIQEFLYKAISIDKVTKWVDRMTSTILHELTHIVQHNKQSHRIKQGKGTEYRSYLEPNNSRFKNLMDKRTPDSHDLYLASPQEIDAFAQGRATDLIHKAMEGKNIEDLHTSDELKQAISQVQALLSDNGKKLYKDEWSYIKFSDSGDPKKLKVFRRFVSRVYQKIKHYLTHLETQLRQIGP